MLRRSVFFLFFLSGCYVAPSAGVAPLEVAEDGGPLEAEVAPDAGRPADCGKALDLHHPGATCPDGSCDVSALRMTSPEGGAACYPCLDGVCERCGHEGEGCCHFHACRDGLTCNTTTQTPTCEASN